MNVAETLDPLRRYGLRIIQPKDGYRFSVDPLLLCSFAGAAVENKSVADLGTGSGIIPLIMTAHYGASETVGIELQQVMADLATRNAALNELSGKVSIMNADLLAVKESFKVSCFDIVLSNPPFRKPGSGRISPKSGRDLARHESTADLSDFLSAAKYLVKPGGRIFFVYLPYRMQEFMAVATELKLSVKRVRMIHGTAGAEARIFLAELVKGGKSQLVVEPPLVLYREGRIYTDEAEGILGEGN